MRHTEFECVETLVDGVQYELFQFDVFYVIRHDVRYRRFVRTRVHIQLSGRKH